jgi:hypothetical protein
MATLTINFTANTTGVHTVYWRNYQDPVNTYPNSLAVTVTVPGVQSVDIPIEENLYCTYEGVEYEGYIIADCMDAEPTTNGIPDSVLSAGSTFTATAAQQPDPCEFVGLKCESVGILDIEVTTGGTGFLETETLVIGAPDLAGGVQATGTITFSAGAITDITITNAGSGYTGVPSVSTSTPSPGDPAAFNVVLEDCPVVDLTSTVCNGTNNINETPEYILPLDGQINYCVDRTSFDDLLAARNELAEADPLHPYSGLGLNGCNCIPCLQVTVDATAASSGAGKVSYQTCYDGEGPYGATVMITRAIEFGQEYDLGCINPDSVYLDQGDLNAPAIVDETICGSFV